MVLWTAFGRSSRCCSATRAFPYAAAQDGYSSASSRRLHPTKDFPHVSLIVIGAVVDRLQFLLARHGHRCADHDPHPGPVHRADIRGHAAAPARARNAAALPHLALPAAEPHRAARLDLHLRDLGPLRHLFGLGTLLLGVAFFFLWSWRTRRWPFAPAAEAAPQRSRVRVVPIPVALEALLGVVRSA